MDWVTSCAKCGGRVDRHRAGYRAEIRQGRPRNGAHDGRADQGPAGAEESPYSGFLWVPICRRCVAMRRLPVPLGLGLVAGLGVGVALSISPWAGALPRWSSAAGLALAAASVTAWILWSRLGVCGGPDEARDRVAARLLRRHYPHLRFFTRSQVRGIR